MVIQISKLDVLWIWPFGTVFWNGWFRNRNFLHFIYDRRIEYRNGIHSSGESLLPPQNGLSDLSAKLKFFFHIFGIFWDKNLMGKLSRNILSALLLPLVHGDQALQVTSCNDENSLVSFPTSISKYYLYGFRDQHFRCEFRNHTLKTIYLVKTVSRWTVVITRKLLTERSFS